MDSAEALKPHFLTHSMSHHIETIKFNLTVMKQREEQMPYIQSGLRKTTS